MHLCQVVAQRHFGLPAQRVVQCVGAHIRVTVAVAAYPLAHAQKAVHGQVTEFAFQVGIQLWDFAQKSRFVITQCVFNLVGYCQLGKAQQAGLPELHDTGAQLCFVGSQLARGECVFGGQSGTDGARCQGQGFDVVTCSEQLRNAAFRVQNTFPLHFCRVGREYWRHKAVRQGICYGFRCNTRPS